MKRAMALATAVVVVAGFAVAADKDRSDGFTPPIPIVAVSEAANDSTKAAAREIAEAIGVKSVIEANHNPTCCVWVEINGWTPTPSEGGWIIVNQPGGTIISAPNAHQLEAAVTAFKKSLRADGKQKLVPIGLMTNYPVVSVADEK